MRLRYGGSASTWGSSRYLASVDEYQDDAILPTSRFADTPEDALDRACGLYLTDPSIDRRRRGSGELAYYRRHSTTSASLARHPDQGRKFRIAGGGIVAK